MGGWGGGKRKRLYETCNARLNGQQLEGYAPNYWISDHRP